MQQAATLQHHTETDKTVIETTEAVSNADAFSRRKRRRSQSIETEKESSTENNSDNDKNAASFDTLLIDAIVPHVCYEALMKLSTSSHDVACYINQKWFHVWFRAAMRFMQYEATGIPDAGTVSVDMLPSFPSYSASSLPSSSATASYRGSVWQPPDTIAIDAGNAQLCDWTCNNGGLCGIAFRAQFSVRISLLVSRSASKNALARDKRIFRVFWQPIVVGVVKPTNLLVTTCGTEIVDVIVEEACNNKNDSTNEKNTMKTLHSPHEYDRCFVYRTFAIDSVTWRDERVETNEMCDDRKTSHRCLTTIRQCGKTKTTSFSSHLHVKMVFRLQATDPQYDRKD